MTVWKINCEWDIGNEDALFETEAKAREFARLMLVNCDIEEPMDELEADGLISFQSIEVAA